ncbi:uncharacterized protein LOC142582030 [Dermacentor variabilis]|uniref:uncharacterized protein LOC142582030 n=1 Tax=Dermacentor variabilis TaxID=34621 RepID=UPI003F5BF84D
MKSATAALVLLLLLFSASVPVMARCPSNEGVFSDCAYTECSPGECAAIGLECCPKPCGGTWCVRGVLR